MAEARNDDSILEGFLCPICKADLKSPNQLTIHFETLHQEEQDVLKSLKVMFGKAKKKILNLDETALKETFEKAVRFAPESVPDFYEPQELGSFRSVSEYYKAVRSAKLERYAAETNKLLIRLDKLVANMPTDQNLRKQHEQEIVPWLDGSSVKLCPGCAKAFNIARRQHHCRLCGSILCHDCSCFFDINIARCMIDPSFETSKLPTNSDPVKTGLRLCEHCYNLIELRKQLQESRNSKTILVTGYEQMRSLMEQATPAAAMYTKKPMQNCLWLLVILFQHMECMSEGRMVKEVLNKAFMKIWYNQSDLILEYGSIQLMSVREIEEGKSGIPGHKMCLSLKVGETTYHLSDANILKSRIAKYAEGIDSLSKQIAALQIAQPGSRTNKLQISIRQAAIHFIKEELLTLIPLPSEAEITEIRRVKREDAEKRIEQERRQTQMNLAKRQATEEQTSGARKREPEGWTVRQNEALPDDGVDDPLVEQMNIIRGYIKQAREELRFEEVAILERNLKELKQEYYLQKNQPVDN